MELDSHPVATLITAKEGLLAHHGSLSLVAMQAGARLGATVTTGSDDNSSATQYAAAVKIGLHAIRLIPWRRNELRPPLDARILHDNIDVVTGEVCITATDLLLPAYLPVKLQRLYASDMAATGIFGPRWVSTWSQWLHHDGDDIIYCADDGRTLRFPNPGLNQSVSSSAGYWPRLTRTDDGYSVERDPRRALHFGFPVDRRWLLTVIGDRNLENIVLEHAPDGRLVAVRHSGGYSLRVHGSPWAVERIALCDRSGSEQELVAYTYDGEGRLVSVKAAGQTAVRYRYDKDNRMVEQEDRNGTSTRYFYGHDGRCMATDMTHGIRQSRLYYDIDWRLTVVTDAAGAQTTYFWNDRQDVVRIMDELGGIRDMFRDTRGNLIAFVNELNTRTHYVYDKTDRLIEVENALGQRSTIEYGENGLPERLRDTAGSEWSLSFDHAGNLVAVGKALGAQARFRRNDKGHIVLASKPTGQNIHYRLDALGLLQGMVDETGQRARCIRDPCGRIREWTNARELATTYRYDDAGRLRGCTAPDGTRHSWQYDHEGNISAYRNPADGVWAFQYGHCNLLTAIKTPTGGVHRLGYDELGRLLTVETATGRVLRIEYDVKGRITEIEHCATGVSRFLYDATGRCIQFENACGQTLVYLRDVLGRIVGKRHSGKEHSVYRYGNNGLLASCDSQGAQCQFGRDDMGRIIQETHDKFCISSVYEAAGRIARLLPTCNVSTSYTLASNGLVDALSSGPDQVKFYFDSMNREVELRANGGLIVHTEYNNSGLPTSQRSRVERPLADDSAGFTDAYIDRRYQYDNLGNCISVRDRQRGTRHCRFDAQGHLMERTDATDLKSEFEYNDMGLPVRISSTCTTKNLPPTGCEYDPAGRLHRQGQMRLEYDAAGRLRRKVMEPTLRMPLEVWEYSWDAEDKLLAMTLPNGDVWTYRYDSLRRRTEKSGPRSNFRFFWDKTALAMSSCTLDQEPAQCSVWDVNPCTGYLLSMHKDGHFYLMLNDNVGAPCELVSGDGRTLWSVKWNEQRPAENTCKQADPAIPRSGTRWFDSESGLSYDFAAGYPFWADMFHTGLCRTAQGMYSFGDPPERQAGLNYWLANMGLTPASIKPWLDNTLSTDVPDSHRNPLYEMLPCPPDEPPIAEPGLIALVETVNWALADQPCPAATIDWLIACGALPVYFALAGQSTPAVSIDVLRRPF